MPTTLQPFQYDAANARLTAEVRIDDIERTTLRHAQDALRELPAELARRIADVVMAERKDEIAAAITPELISQAVSAAITALGERVLFDHLRAMKGQR